MNNRSSPAWCLLYKDKPGTSLLEYYTYDDAWFAAITILQEWIAMAADATDEEWNNMIINNYLKICHLNKSSGEIDVYSGLPDAEYIKRHWLLRS